MEINNKFQNAKIYKITDIGYNKCYMGSTTEELSQRMARHRACFKHFLNGSDKRHVRIYDIFNEYGIENCKIELIEYYKCDTLQELRRKEGEHIKNTECVNKRVEGRTAKEYHEDNKNKRNEQTREYYQKNKDRLNEQKKEYYQKHKDKLYELHKEYREKHKDKLNEQTREYYQKNKDKLNEKRRERYKLKKETQKNTIWT